MDEPTRQQPLDYRTADRSAVPTSQRIGGFISGLFLGLICNAFIVVGCMSVRNPWGILLGTVALAANGALIAHLHRRGGRARSVGLGLLAAVLLAGLLAGTCAALLR